MKTELEPQDIEAIAQRVAEKLKPVIAVNDANNYHDRMFDVKRLAEYIGMSPQWIYNNKYKLPHVNINSKPLFRKSEIDRWLESCRVHTGNRTIELPVLKGMNHENKIQTKGFNHQKR